MMFGKSSKRRPLDTGVQRLSQEAAPRTGKKHHHPLNNVALLVAFGILVAVVTRHDTANVSEYDIHAEAVAREDIFAEFGFESEELQLTKEAREAAMARVPSIYRVQDFHIAEQLEQFDARLLELNELRDVFAGAIRDALADSTAPQTEGDVVAAAVLATAKELFSLKDEHAGITEPEALAVLFIPSTDSVPTRQFASVPDAEPAQKPTLIEPEVTPMRFPNLDQLAAAGRQNLQYVLHYGVLEASARPGAVDVAAQREIGVVRGETLGDLKARENLALSQTLGVDEARNLLRTRIADASLAPARARTAIAVDEARLRDALVMVTEGLIVPTLEFDTIATDHAKQEADAQVESVPRNVPANALLIGRGEFWTEQSRKDVETYWEKSRTGQEPVETLIAALLAHSVLIAMALAALQRSVTLMNDKNSDPYKTMMVVLLLMCVTAVIGRITWYIEPTGYSVPIAAMAILLVILTNMRVALVASLLTAGLLSVLFDYDWRLVVVAMAMSFAGAFSIVLVRKRGEMARATVKATLAGLVVVAAVTIATDSFAWALLGQRLALVLLHGFLAYMLVPAVLSPLERLFGITTDIQLLEYSDLNNEILGRLAIEVPATYAHSLMLGQLAEAAADAIGANGLKARVCAYYHDIGKMLRPEYFSENQTGTNIHDEMTPRASCRAIASHVSGGMQLAREYHLPQPIIDAIVEHHGTMLISFFYQEALKQQKHGDVQESEFRYPGPKPQSRETAILMICDAVESGVRSIKNPNEERVREFVDKIIQARSADRQFDECDITLKDLDRIGDVVTKRMLTSLHTRIAYPEREKDKPDERRMPAMASASVARAKR